MRKKDQIVILALGVVGAALAATRPSREGTSPAPTNARETLSFPSDHGSHPDAPVEWWYFTGHLQDPEHNEYGFQVTFFRVRELHLAHFAWTNVHQKTFEYAEKTHLGLPGIASAAEGRLEIANEDWFLVGEGAKARIHVRARFGELDVQLVAVKAPVANGSEGLSRKGAGTDEYSHYVSIPRWKAAGIFRKDARQLDLSGTAWFDHEWGPGVLPKEARGWDWFALQLEDGSDLMLYRMRGEDGQATPYSAGTFSPNEGAPAAISWRDVELTETARWQSPRSGAKYPSRWMIRVRSLGLDLEVEPLLGDQELVTEQSTGVIYWEGTCRVRGTRNGRPAAGRAYVELTGYARRDVPGFGPSGAGSR